MLLDRARLTVSPVSTLYTNLTVIFTMEESSHLSEREHEYIYQNVKLLHYLSEVCRLYLSFYFQLILPWKRRHNISSIYSDSPVFYSPCFVSDLSILSQT